MRKNKKAILSFALAASLFLSGATSHAAFSAGQKITKFKYNSKNGTVSVMADVDGSSAGTYYKYKGEINYASAAKLNIYVEGYYVSNGTYRLVTNEKTVASQKSATVYAYVPGGKTGVSTKKHPSSSTGYIKSSKVASAKYPS